MRPAVGAAVEQPSYLHSLILDRHVSRVTSSDAMGFLPEKDARAPQPGDEISYDSRCYVLCVRRTTEDEAAIQISVDGLLACT